MSIIVTFMFEDKIKYTLAQYGHYFDNKPPQELSTPTNKKKFTFINKTIGVKFFIPTTWEEKQNKNGLTYYILKENNQTRIELVPGCFHHSELILPEIIHNIVEQNRLLKYQFKKQCYIGSNGSYVCFIKSSNIKNNKNLTEKWQILIMQSKRKQNIDLKFNFYGKPTVNNKKDIIAIIKSVKILPLPNLIPYCISTEDWF